MATESAPAEPQGMGVKGFFWALRAGWLGGCLTALPVSLATGGEYFPTALACGVTIFVLALVGAALCSAGDGLARGVGRVLVSGICVVILLGLLIFAALRIGVEWAKPRTAPTCAPVQVTFGP